MVVLHQLDRCDCRTVARFSPVRYDGQVTDVRARAEAVRRFQEDDTPMLFVANPAAAGAGLTLHRARIAVYRIALDSGGALSSEPGPDPPPGQTRDVDYVFLVCEGTIEQQEYDRIAAKEAVARELLSDGGGTPRSRGVPAEAMIFSGCWAAVHERARCGARAPYRNASDACHVSRLRGGVGRAAARWRSPRRPEVLRLTPLALRR